MTVRAPKKFVPRPYQSYCINRLLAGAEMMLLLDMGLGKTVITQTVVNDLKFNRFAISKCLVLAPKKVADDTWAREQSTWEHLKLLRVIKVLGTEKQRIRALNTPGDIYVINHENTQWIVDYYRNAWPFDMVVIDEISRYKNHMAKRFKAMTWIRKHVSRFVGLTGTPTPKSLLDLWAQMYLVDAGKRLGKVYGGFRERFFEPDQRDRDHVFSYAPKPGAEEQIYEKISDICISMNAADYLDLPGALPVTVPVILDTKAKAAYSKLEKEMLLQVDGTTIDAGSAAVLTNKLLQLCNGAVYDENRNTVEIHHCKVEAFMELVETLNGKPALVFYSFQHDVARIKQALSKTGLHVREIKTTKDIDDWNDKKIDIGLLHPASGGHGLNLQFGGNHAIWFGLPWSLELYQQANKRLDRPGQTEKVIIHHLIVEGGVDEDVMEALADKSNTQNRLLTALKARIERAKE
ncbi:SNF2-related protein [Heliophilum fasciatum]|uniref:SNF2 domain-containing protein n=1 Tax=Heliophilum fasciatum TaxID=35700 RepID=A0A4R2RP00_9FIRM|nr:DEAD/DEAH box helicase [Heliophilum fasciatum]MCW2277747.1 SNF2 family DNA or RNA helicase [Heliophilum fasciatum]TCP64758.1 SNF2 domain-containing protein [Heliophilum fasciatum]